MWLDIDYKDSVLIPDNTVIRMLIAIRTTIFPVGESSQATVEGYTLALAQLRQIMAAERGKKTLFEQAGFSLEETSQVLQMLEATTD